MTTILKHIHLKLDTILFQLVITIVEKDTLDLFALIFYIIIPQKMRKLKRFG